MRGKFVVYFSIMLPKHVQIYWKYEKTVKSSTSFILNYFLMYLTHFIQVLLNWNLFSASEVPYFNELIQSKKKKFKTIYILVACRILNKHFGNSLFVTAYTNVGDWQLKISKTEEWGENYQKSSVTKTDTNHVNKKILEKHWALHQTLF